MSDDENPPPKMEDQIVGPEDTTMTKQKIDLVLVRIGNSCLISSVLLFVSLIIVAAVSWRPDASSLVIGFVFSLTLFMVWLSIHGVYGSKSGGLVNAGNFQVLVMIIHGDGVQINWPKEVGRGGGRFLAPTGRVGPTENMRILKHIFVKYIDKDSQNSMRHPTIWIFNTILYKNKFQNPQIFRRTHGHGPFPEQLSLVASEAGEIVLGENRRKRAQNDHKCLGFT
jgi:hypothetical protein